MRKDVREIIKTCEPWETANAIEKEYEIKEAFENAIKAALRTEKIAGFRLCVDKQEKISTTDSVKGSGIPKCPTGTIKVLDVVITPGRYALLRS
jgi:hypothetical protein